MIRSDVGNPHIKVWTYPILFETVNAEVWELSQPPPFPIAEGFGFCFHILGITCVCELIQD